MKNSKFNSNDVKHCCENKLKISFNKSRSKEFNGWYRLMGDNKKFTKISVPKGEKFIATKTYKNMAKQLKLGVEEFDDLLECFIKRKEYEELVLNRHN